MVLLLSDRSRNWVEINAIHLFMKQQDVGKSIYACEREGRRQADYVCVGFAEILL